VVQLLAAAYNCKNCKKLLVRHENSSGTHKRGNVHCWKPLQTHSSEDVILDNSVWIIVNCIV
jgi:hypothetical protein